MPSKSEAGYVRVKERIPYFGKGVDELVLMVRKTLAENKNTQKVTLEVGVPYIAIEKLVPQDEHKEQATKPLSIHDTVRNKPMEDYEADAKMVPLQQLFEMFQIVQREGFEVCHILVGDKLKFQKWLGVRIPQTNLSILGTPLTITGDIPDDVFVICGAPTRDAEADEILYSVKGTL